MARARGSAAAAGVQRTSWISAPLATAVSRTRQPSTTHRAARRDEEATRLRTSWITGFLRLVMMVPPAASREELDEPSPLGKGPRSCARPVANLLGLLG